MSFEEKEEREEINNNETLSNYYKFDLNKILVQDVDYLLKNNSIDHVYLCCYSINNTGLYPFIQYYLLRQNNMLVFPLLDIESFKQNNIEMDSENLINLGQTYLYTLLINEDIDINKENDFKGFCYYNSSIYLFVDFTNCNLNLNDIYRRSNIWTIISTEIYQSTLFDMKISNQVNSFFLNNIELLYLLDQNDELYELPDVWYCGREEHSLNLTYTFGVTKDENGILGPYYYFTNYKNALIDGCWPKNNNNNDDETFYGKRIIDKNGKYLKGGIVRFAIFTGRCLMKMNKISDPIDNSEIKKNKLHNSIDNICDIGNNESLTMRLTDYDGTWTENYDSVFIGKIELDNGKKFEEGPIIAIKDYNQQIPLSYHYVDNRFIIDRNDISQYMTIR